MGLTLGSFPDGCAQSTSKETPDVRAPHPKSSYSPGEPHFGCLYHRDSRPGFVEVPHTFQAGTLMCKGRLVSRDVRVITERNINSYDLGAFLSLSAACRRSALSLFLHYKKHARGCGRQGEGWRRNGTIVSQMTLRRGKVRWGGGGELQEVKSYRAQPPSALTDDPITACGPGRTRKHSSGQTGFNSCVLHIRVLIRRCTDHQRSTNISTSLSGTGCQEATLAFPLMFPVIPSLKTGGFDEIIILRRPADVRNMKQNNKRPLTLIFLVNI